MKAKQDKLEEAKKAVDRFDTVKTEATLTKAKEKLKQSSAVLMIAQENHVKAIQALELAKKELEKKEAKLNELAMKRDKLRHQYHLALKAHKDYLEKNKAKVKQKKSADTASKDEASFEKSSTKKTVSKVAEMKKNDSASKSKDKIENDTTSKVEEEKQEKTQKENQAESTDTSKKEKGATNKKMEKEETEEKKNSVMPLAIGFISTASIIGIGLYIYKRRND